ncbi:MAG: DciA family protein [Actinomycetota bacterium]
MSAEPRPLSSGIERLLRSFRQGDRATTVTVFSRWTELVGDAVAQHVRPLKLDRGVLVVQVDDPAWATQMRFLESDLLERLSAAGSGPVERVEIRVKKGR